jgi:hypothetical protein
MARWVVSVEPELAAGAQGPVTTAVTVALMTWGKVLGLPVLLADEQFLSFGAGGDSRLVVTKSSTGTAEARPPTGWCVAGGRR